MTDNHQAIPDLWIAWGGPAAWPDESLPPSSRQFADIEAPLIFKRPERVDLCRPVNSAADGDFMHRGQKYRFVTDDDSSAEAGRFLYLRGRLDPAKGDPIGVFRQSAVFAELIPSPGHEGAMRLWPAEISDRGRLVCVCNRYLTRIDATTVLTENIIIEEL